MGSRLRLIWQWVRDRIYGEVRAAGYDDVGPAHVFLFRMPSMHGRRPSDIAETMQITKQSVNELLGHLERQGYLTREVDPADNRARIVRYTRKGHTFERIVIDAARRADRELSKMLGATRFRRLRTDLDELVRLTEMAPEGPDGQAGSRRSASSSASKQPARPRPST